MILGWCMELRSESGQAGIRIPDCFLPARELRLGWALEWASTAGLAGDGTTGDLTGITTMSFTTTTRTYPTAEFSSIATTSIARADFAGEVDFTAALRAAEVSPHRSMGSRRHMPRLAITPARSADLIMEERQEASQLGGSRALVEVSTEVEASTEAEAMAAAVTGNPVRLQNTKFTRWRMKSCALRI